MSFPRPAAVAIPKSIEKPESQPESRPESLAIRIIKLIEGEPLSKSEISRRLGQKSVSGQLNKVIRALLIDGCIEFTLPEKTNSRLQKYRLTPEGRRQMKKTGKRDA